MEAVSGSQREHPRRIDRCIQGPLGAGSDNRRHRCGRYQGPLIGIVRAEFEYEFPIDHAERMLSTFCRDDTLEKQRFFVENAGATWHVDVYGGILQGIVIAEIAIATTSRTHCSILSILRSLRSTCAGPSASSRIIRDRLSVPKATR